MPTGMGSKVMHVNYRKYGKLEGSVGYKRSYGKERER